MRHPKALSGAAAIGLAVALMSAGCASSDSAPTGSQSASAATPSTSAVAFTPEVEAELQQVLDSIRASWIHRRAGGVWTPAGQ